MARAGNAVGFFELFMIAIGLSMDAFAVSICKGLGMHRLDVRQGAIIAAFFGGFQALMPVLGWALGSQFAQFVTAVSHWVAFALLAFVGGKMLWDALRNEEDEEPGVAPRGWDGAAGTAVPAQLDIRELFILAVATSIDAFAVGVSFAFLDVAIAPSAALIGVTTFALAFVGVAIGHQFGRRWERPATFVGGLVLVAIGLKVLLEGLGILG